MQASHEIRVMADVSASELDSLLERGWRRFGPVYFRPVCGTCAQCISVRIDVEKFALTRNLRRIANKCAQIEMVVRPPIFSLDRFKLYQRWHQMREAARHWEPDATSARTFAVTFCLPHACAREVAYYQNSELIALAYADITDTSLSAVYCVYEPEKSDYSLGTFNVLSSIDFARKNGLRYVYLGYCVLDCASLVYKARFAAKERLIGRPRLSEAPIWQQWQYP